MGVSRLLPSLSKSGSLGLGALGMLDQSVCPEGCLVQCRTFSSVPGFYPLEANRNALSPLFGTTQNASRHCEMSPNRGGKKSSLAKKEICPSR